MLIISKVIVQKIIVIVTNHSYHRLSIKKEDLRFKPCCTDTTAIQN